MVAELTDVDGGGKGVRDVTLAHNYSLPMLTGRSQFPHCTLWQTQLHTLS